MDYYEKSMKMHAELHGKLEVRSKVPVSDKEALSTAYTPGVAQPCIEIAKDPSLARELTIKRNTVAVVSDGSAVLGLGNIGGLASLPVMEGKAVLFKEFGDVDAWPIVLDTQDPDRIVDIVKAIAPGFGGINLEDISAPRCFEVERRLQEELDIPVFHDDQHGTAIVVSAAVINAFKLIGKPLAGVRTFISGAGAAGTACAKMLKSLGAGDIVVLDSKGIISPDRAIAGAEHELSPDKKELLSYTNADGISGGLAEAAEGRDLFIGVSGPRILSKETASRMSKGGVIFAMSNPEPEISVDDAKASGAAVVGTGRSDTPNQINNVLVFPGLFKGALAANAARITEEMKVAAAYALAAQVADDELCAEYVIPPAFKPGVADAVADAVAKAWKEK